MELRTTRAVTYAAAVPALTVNWGGEDVVSIQDWCAYLTELTGVEIPLTVGPTAMPSVVADVTKQHEIAGKAEIGWRDGFRRMIETRHPDLLQNSLLSPPNEPDGRTR